MFTASCAGGVDATFPHESNNRIAEIKRAQMQLLFEPRA
jgi:hypothetical protein